MTLTLDPQFVVDSEKRPKAVLLTLNEWEQILEALEELEDIHAYDSAKTDAQESIPFDQAVREIEEDYGS